MLLLLLRTSTTGGTPGPPSVSGTRVLTFSTAVAYRLTLSTGTGIRKTLSTEG